MGHHHVNMAKSTQCPFVAGIFPAGVLDGGFETSQISFSCIMKLCHIKNGAEWEKKQKKTLEHESTLHTRGLES